MYPIKNQVKFHKKNILDYIYKENIFTKDFCSKKINELKNLDLSMWRTHTWSSTTNYDKKSNIEDFSITYSDIITHDMISGIENCLLNYRNNISPKFFNISRISNIRINRYDVGERMLEHVDHIFSIFDGENRGIPVISILGVFNNDYEGGDFFICEEKINLNAGDILIFPSSFLYPHRVDPVTKGSRYSWITWGY